MKYGIKKIIARMTMGDEFGLYRINEDKKQYLMVSFSTYKEVQRYGLGMGKLLNVAFDNWLAEPDHEEDEDAEPDKKKVTFKKHMATVDPKARPKARRVSGVAKTVGPLVSEGKTDEEIFVVMWPKYEAANRTEPEARELLFSYLKDMRSGKV